MQAGHPPPTAERAAHTPAGGNAEFSGVGERPGHPCVVAWGRSGCWSSTALRSSTSWDHGRSSRLRLRCSTVRGEPPDVALLVAAGLEPVGLPTSARCLLAMP